MNDRKMNHTLRPDRNPFEYSLPPLDQHNGGLAPHQTCTVMMVIEIDLCEFAKMGTF